MKTESFPYLKIARECGLAYGVVIRAAAWYDGDRAFGWVERMPAEVRALDRGHRALIFCAVDLENSRRVRMRSA